MPAVRDFHIVGISVAIGVGLLRVALVDQDFGGIGEGVLVRIAGEEFTGAPEGQGDFAARGEGADLEEEFVGMLRV